MLAPDFGSLLDVKSICSPQQLNKCTALLTVYRARDHRRPVM